MLETLAIFGAVFAGIFILLMLGHVVNWVRKNYMDDFSERFGENEKKNFFDRIKGSMDNDIHKNTNIEEDDNDFDYHPDTGIVLKNALQKLDCKIETISDEHLSVTCQKTVFEFILDKEWLSIYLPFIHIPLSIPNIHQVYEIINEINRTVKSIKILVYEDKEKSLMEVVVCIDIDIDLIPRQNNECCDFIGCIFSTFVDITIFFNEKYCNMHTEYKWPTNLN